MQHIRNNAYKALNLIKTIAKKHWARGTKFLITVVRAVVRSRLTYGQECFFAAAPSHLKIIESIETIALKIALGVPKYAQNRLVYAEVGWLSLSEERYLRTCQYLIRSQILPNNLFGKLENSLFPLKIKGKRNPKYFTRILPYTLPLLKRCSFTLDNIEQWAPATKPPNQRAKIQIATTMKPGSTKANNPGAGAEAMEIITTKYKNHLQVYTDGSVQTDSLKTGFGIIFKPPEKGFQNKVAKRTPDGLSTFTVEMTAICFALKIIQDKYANYKDVVIFTDSLSSIQAAKREQKVFV